MARISRTRPPAAESSTSTTSRPGCIRLHSQPSVSFERTWPCRPLPLGCQLRSNRGGRHPLQDACRSWSKIFAVPTQWQRLRNGGEILRLLNRSTFSSPRVSIDQIALDRIFQIADRPNLTREIWEKFRYPASSARPIILGSEIGILMDRCSF